MGSLERRDSFPRLPRAPSQSVRRQFTTRCTTINTACSRALLLRPPAAIEAGGAGEGVCGAARDCAPEPRHHPAEPWPGLQSRLVSEARCETTQSGVAMQVRLGKPIGQEGQLCDTELGRTGLV